MDKEKKFCAWSQVDACNTYRCCHYCTKANCEYRCKDDPHGCKYNEEVDPAIAERERDAFLNKSSYTSDPTVRKIDWKRLLHSERRVVKSQPIPQVEEKKETQFPPEFKFKTVCRFCGFEKPYRWKPEWYKKVDDQKCSKCKETHSLTIIEINKGV